MSTRRCRRGSRKPGTRKPGCIGCRIACLKCPPGTPRHVLAPPRRTMPTASRARRGTGQRALTKATSVTPDLRPCSQTTSRGTGRLTRAEASATARATIATKTKCGVATVSCIRVAALARLQKPSATYRKWSWPPNASPRPLPSRRFSRKLEESTSPHNSAQRAALLKQEVYQCICHKWEERFSIEELGECVLQEPVPEPLLARRLHRGR